MKLQAERKHLAEAVKLASSPTKRGLSSFLECLLIEADAGLKITGTDMDQSVIASCVASVSSPGAVVVRADDLSRWLQSMPQGALVDAVKSEAGLRLSAGRSSITLPSLDPEDFPRPTQSEGIEIAGGVEAYRACLPFVATEEARYYLCGVAFGGGAAVATDGKFFHRVNVDYGGPSVIVPSNASRSIISAGGRMFVGERHWRCEGEGVVAVGKVIDGTFPDWKRLDADHRWFGEVDVDALQEAITAATIGVSQRVVLSASGGEIVANGEGWNGAQNASASSCAYDGDDFAVVFPTKYISTALAPYSGTVAKIGATGAGVAITSSDDTICLCVPFGDVRQRLP